MLLAFPAEHFAQPAGTDGLPGKGCTGQMLESLLEVILEFIFQCIAEALFELGLHAMTEPFRHPPNPFLAATGYALLGCLAGAISLWPFPFHLVASPALRLLNLLLTPAGCGSAMALLGRLRARRGQRLLRLDCFSYGFLFALSLGLVRFFYAK